METIGYNLFCCGGKCWLRYSIGLKKDLFLHKKDGVFDFNTINENIKIDGFKPKKHPKMLYISDNHSVI